MDPVTVVLRKKGARRENPREQIQKAVAGGQACNSFRSSLQVSVFEYVRYKSPTAMNTGDVEIGQIAKTLSRREHVLLTFYPIPCVGGEIGKKGVCIIRVWSEDIGRADDPVK